MSGENQKERIKFLMLDGKTNDEILTLTHQPMGVITRTRGWFNSPYGKVWQQRELKRKEAEQAAKNPPPPPPLAVAQPPASPGPQAVMQPSRDLPPGVLGLRQGDNGASSVLSNGLEQELLLMGAPLIRKVVLNTKVYFWFDFARAKMNFKGDIGDFVFDCVEDFFRSRNYQIIVEKREVTDVR